MNCLCAVGHLLFDVPADILPSKPVVNCLTGSHHGRRITGVARDVFVAVLHFVIGVRQFSGTLIGSASLLPSCDRARRRYRPGASPPQSRRTAENMLFASRQSARRRGIDKIRRPFGGPIPKSGIARQGRSGLMTRLDQASPCVQGLEAWSCSQRERRSPPRSRPLRITSADHPIAHQSVCRAASEPPDRHVPGSAQSRFCSTSTAATSRFRSVIRSSTVLNDQPAATSGCFPRNFHDRSGSMTHQAPRAPP
jgi:hypothetical protein